MATGEVTVRFMLPDGRDFRQFSMPGIPRRGDYILNGDKGWEVAEVVWDLTAGGSIHGAEISILLKEAER